MGCPVCGSETAELAQPCMGCGGSVIVAEPPRPRAGDSDEPGESGQSPDSPPSVRPNSSTRILMFGGIAATVLVAILLGNSLNRPPLMSAIPTTGQLTEGQLQSGDCLTGNLGLGTGAGWPGTVTAVPCGQRHTAEIFFAAAGWSTSLPFPGSGAEGTAAETKCTSAFAAVVHRQRYLNAFAWDYVVPDEPAWNSGHPGARLLVCVAYDPTARYPAGAPVNYSIESAN